jgi:hypothetical protein
MITNNKEDQNFAVFSSYLQRLIAIGQIPFAQDGCSLYPGSEKDIHTIFLR